MCEFECLLVTSSSSHFVTILLSYFNDPFPQVWISHESENLIEYLHLSGKKKQFTSFSN